MSSAAKALVLVQKRIADLLPTTVMTPVHPSVLVTFLVGEERTTRRKEEDEALGTCIRGIGFGDSDEIVSMRLRKILSNDYS